MVAIFSATLHLMPEKDNNRVCRCEIYLEASLFAMIGLGCWHLGKCCKWIKMPVFIPNDRWGGRNDSQWTLFFVHCFREFKMEFHFFLLHADISCLIIPGYCPCCFTHLSSLFLLYCFLQKTGIQKIIARINLPKKSAWDIPKAMILACCGVEKHKYEKYR